MSAGHSIVAPSSASRWVFCSGAPGLEAKYPDESTQASLEGEASHWVASTILSVPGSSADDCYGFVNSAAPSGVIIDDSMVIAAAVYVAAVLSIAPQAGLVVERPVKIPSIHTACYGTPDCWYYDHVSRTLHIWDYKYGWGIVEAFENWQLICYYSGIIDELRIPDMDIRVKFHVVQPRPWHEDGYVRDWSVPAVDLRADVNHLANAAGKVLGSVEPVEYCTGLHCRYCKGIFGGCLANQRSGMYAVDVIESSATRALTGEELGIEVSILRRAAKTLEYRLVGLEAQGLELIRSGTPVAGQCASTGRGSTKWTKPDAEIFALGDLMGVDLRKAPAPVTPNQAEKAGLDPTMAAMYSKKMSGKLRLAPDDNTKARKIFGGTPHGKD